MVVLTKTSYRLNPIMKITEIASRIPMSHQQRPATVCKRVIRHEVQVIGLAA